MSCHHELHRDITFASRETIKRTLGLKSTGVRNDRIPQKTILSIYQRHPLSLISALLCRISSRRNTHMTLVLVINPLGLDLALPLLLLVQDFSVGLVLLVLGPGLASVALDLSPHHVTPHGVTRRDPASWHDAMLCAWRRGRRKLTRSCRAFSTRALGTFRNFLFAPSQSFSWTSSCGMTWS